MSYFTVYGAKKHRLIEGLQYSVRIIDKITFISTIFTMKSYTASQFSLEKKFEVVYNYSKKGGSLRKTAHILGISYITLWKWVNRYKKEGKEGLQRRISHQNTGKKFSEKIAHRIMLLKENRPSLTTKMAAGILRRQEIEISHKGVWDIWRRYGLVNRPKDRPLTTFKTGILQAENCIKHTKLLFEKGQLKEAAKLLNQLPVLNDGAILKEIPEAFLSARRKLDYLHFQFGTLPHLVFYKKARKIRKMLEKRGHLFSSIIAGFLEVYALQWMGEPEKQLKILDIIAKRMGIMRDTSLKFLLHFQQAVAQSDLLQMDKTSENIKRCKRRLSSLCLPFYLEAFGDLLTFVSRYRNSIEYYEKALAGKEIGQITKQRLFLKISAMFGMTGQYAQSSKYLNYLQATDVAESYLVMALQNKANIRFANGQLAEASCQYREVLEKAKGANLHNVLYASLLGSAQVAQALGKENEAQSLIARFLPLMAKHQMENEFLNLRFLLNQTAIPEAIRRFPIHHLRFLLDKTRRTSSIKDYHETLDYAKRKNLLGIFHRHIVFFPKPVLYLLEKGRPTGLPRTILNFPVFNQKIPVYHLKFLGNFVVFKNQRYVKMKMTPKEKAFLIQIALNAGAPKKFILLSDLHHNFWLHNRNPSSLLLHLLIRLKKKLMLPGHLLGISSRYAQPRFVNQGIYFTTDYQQYEQTLAQAKALERTGEWGFARQEYLRAFKLFRGEPFKKNFDEWSVNIRHKILTELESEAMNFAKSCLEHGDKDDAKRILAKVLKIIPDAEEVNRIVGQLKD